MNNNLATLAKLKLSLNLAALELAVDKLIKYI